MKAVIQRVSKVELTIEDCIFSSIDDGLLVLLGICHEDTITDIQWLSQKIVNMRIFNDEKGLMNRNVIEIVGKIMVVSQFTLYASTKKGNRPGFTEAASPSLANELYEQFLVEIQKLIPQKIETGKFGADMKIQLINDGPVTIIIDTKNKS
ncbi:MAG: D-aminoacyl-tRNA deacylase [Saprospiraceae bacterium]|jgi:D-tyrosyl-tRNA(Tyr) deacylase|nr:D-tyrosyl-tRNA(Tyr) deacylase [Saprospiraceae bacterium]MBK7465723.1 D-tyrosyl-tRNA(Tyr) deacylase [Saprospiraceae bacterium]MBK9993852.1 D-tyrosyl-tRNA(Tyr) deacylase [Saprospiraceae bacterium]